MSMKEMKAWVSLTLMVIYNDEMGHAGLKIQHRHFLPRDFCVKGWDRFGYTGYKRIHICMVG